MILVKSSANRGLAATMWRRRPSAKLIYNKYNYRMRPPLASKLPHKTVLTMVLWDI